MKRKSFWIVALVLALMPPARPVQAATYTVTNTNDSGVGSLRWAISQANANPGADTIAFNIPGAGVHTIAPLTALPILTGGGTTIDGYTQPGAEPTNNETPATILIEIDGTNTTNQSGLYIASADNVVRGLAINRFDWDGIGIGLATATGNVIAGNHLGTDPGGTIDRGNGHSGVYVGLGATNNTIGGDEPAERNVLSGNEWSGVEIHGSGTTSNTVSGNYIGTRATGMAALGNTLYGVRIYGGAQNNRIGGDNENERNVISGNGGYGVFITDAGTSGNVVSGNFIGTDLTGMVALGNAGGVSITNAQNNLVGGDTPGERNVISGNTWRGVGLVNHTATGNTISGNYIGVNASGTAALGNGDGVEISLAENNTIGGDSAGERNVISGNNGYGVEIAGGSGNILSGNHIGVDAGGNTDLGNMGDGVYLDSGAQGNTIGGDTDGERNVISGNGDEGIALDGADDNTVTGNYIGVNAAGTAALGNDDFGMYIGGGAQNNTIGGTTPAEGNVISNNGRDGIYVADSSTAGNVISGNYIGTDASGTAAMGNGQEGIELDFGTHGNTVGPGNIIAHNAFGGVLVDNSTTIDNDITQNSIFANTGLGIELSEGAHGGIAAPVIVTTTVGSVNVVGTACAGCTVEVFENSDTDGEGETYVGNTTATASGAFTVTVSSLSKPYLTATATDVVSGTSEFSAVFTATVPLAPPVSPVYLPIILNNAGP